MLDRIDINLTAELEAGTEKKNKFVVFSQLSLKLLVATAIVVVVVVI